MSLSVFREFFGPGSATAGEKKSLVKDKPVGLFYGNEISITEPQELAIQLSEANNNATLISLSAAKLSSQADRCKEGAASCGPEEKGKSDLLHKAETAYNNAAKAMALSDTPDSIQSEKWGNISVAYQGAAQIFVKSSTEQLEPNDLKESVDTAELLMHKADEIKQRLQSDQLLPFSQETEGDEIMKERCTIA